MRVFVWLAHENEHLSLNVGNVLERKTCMNNKKLMDSSTEIPRGIFSVSLCALCGENGFPFIRGKSRIGGSTERAGLSSRRLVRRRAHQGSASVPGQKTVRKPWLWWVSPGLRPSHIPTRHWKA